MEKETEREERGSAGSRNEGGGWFFVDFELNCLPWTMKIKSIYRR